MVTHDCDFDGLQHWRVATPKGRVIYDEGEAAEAFYRVESGCVRLQVNREDGGRQILAFLMPGDVFGLDRDGVRHAAAEAAVKSELTRFQAAPPLGLETNPDAAAGVVCAACDMITALTAHLVGLSRTSAEDRVRWFLDWMAERQGVGAKGGAVNLPMSRRDIADFLDLAPETLSRTMRRLEALGHIKAFGSRRVQLRPSRTQAAAGRGLASPDALWPHLARQPRNVLRAAEFGSGREQRGGAGGKGVAERVGER